MTGRALFIFPGQSRSERLAGIDTGDVPKEFFYGYLALRDAGYDVAIADARREPDDFLGRLLVRLEIRRNSFINLGYSKQRVRALRSALAQADLALSFTDGFSLSLGLYGRQLSNPPMLLGGFHGLADMIDRVRPLFANAMHKRVRTALLGLDHMFFSGEPDRLQSIKLFDLPPERTSLYRFGIDTEFWCPRDVPEEEIVFAVGSDLKRDFATLVSAPTSMRRRILTRLPVDTADDGVVELIRGSYQDSPVTDRKLRDMYRAAAIVAVPLQDVWQPTGCSVTLQAMACGRPVVLSDIKGLWDRALLRDSVNCLLVPPNNPAAMAAAIDRLRADPALRQRIGMAARNTAEVHFPLQRMNEDIMGLAGRFGASPTLAQQVLPMVTS